MIFIFPPSIIPSPPFSTNLFFPLRNKVRLEMKDDPGIVIFFQVISLLTQFQGFSFVLLFAYIFQFQFPLLSFQIQKLKTKNPSLNLRLFHLFKFGSIELILYILFICVQFIFWWESVTFKYQQTFIVCNKKI